MTQQRTRYLSRIARRAVKQGARPANASQVAVEKPVTETPPETTHGNQSATNKNPLLKGKSEKTIRTLNVQTLNKDGKIPEMIASAETSNHDIICIQEHRFILDDLVTKKQTHGTCSAWKNSVNASTGGIGILISSTAYNALGSVEKISPRIMVATFNGNPQTTVATALPT